MIFYRPATEEDFKTYEVEFRGYRYMDDATKKLIECGEFIKAVNNIRNMYGFGLVESRKYCKIYETFVKAKEDFKQGKPVYVPY